MFQLPPIGAYSQRLPALQPHASAGVRFSSDSAYIPNIKRIDHIHRRSTDKPASIENAISRLKSGEKIIVGKKQAKLEQAMRDDRSIVAGFRTTSEDRRISSLHLQIERRGNVLYAIDMGTTNGTQHFPLRGEPVPLPGNQEKEIKVGETLQICDSRLRIKILPFNQVVEIHHTSHTQQNSGQPITDVLKRLQPGEKIIIGRDDNELNGILGKNSVFKFAFQPCTSDKSISRVHLIIERRKDGFYAFDLNTKTGTTLKTGQAPPTTLIPYEYTPTMAGDELSLGQHGMKFIIPEISLIDSAEIRKN